MNRENAKVWLQKTVRGMIISASGAGAVYFLQAISTMDFGSYTLVVGAISAALINGVREWLKANQT